MGRKFHLATVMMLAIVGFAISCASTRQEPLPAYRPVWPPAPDEPRVVFVKSIAGPADIGWHPSFFRRMGNWITGDDGASQNLQKPFGIAVDDVGNLCLTDTGNNTVCYLDLTRKQWRRWNAAGKTRFKTPVAVARKQGVFYVADSELGKVIGFDEAGKTVLEIAAPLQRPAGLAIAGDALVVADSQSHSVFVFDLQGKFRFQFGRRGVGPGEFNFPTHVGVDDRGRLLVTDSLNSRVQTFTADGKFISEFGGSGDTSGHFGRPKGVAADTFGHIYVADAVYDNVQVFDAGGRLLLNLGETGTRSGQFGLPNGIAIGRDNRIYITDGYNHRVQVLQYVGAP